MGCVRIHPDLAALAFPVDCLTPLPGNPRKGDVKAVARSYSSFGQRKPIVARREGNGGIVIAGNHQLAAARQLGWEEIAVVWVDDDTLTAKAFALADNHTADLGSYTDDLLVEMIAAVAEDAEMIAATSYAEADIAKLQGDLLSGDAELTDLLDEEWGVVITCESESQQVELLAQFTAEGLTVRALVT